ncbi:MAG TPA: DUF2911 domain-containing protein [Cyclobacteriaceae bacterium]|nr:DUF2911 domain-containing protein [Cyclobacteriaceae bacterium]
MKKSITLMLLALVVTLGFAQEDKSKRPSPPAVAEGTIDGVKIKIDYSQPSAKGRTMLGGIEAYGKVWRTGANEATIFETDKAIKIEGQNLPAGKYELFTIPGATDWVIIFQKYGKQWGAYSYKESNDVLRVNVKASKAPSFVETFNISVGKDQVILKWENTLVAFKAKG